MKTLKKLTAVLCAALCLLFTGCDDDSFAKNEYDDNAKIASSSDRCVKVNAVINNLNGNFKYYTAEFNGRDTIWTDSLERARKVTVSVSMSLDSGNAKVVYINPDDTVTVLAECNSEQGRVSQKNVVEMPEGKNRIKVVGYDCDKMSIVTSFYGL